MFPSLLACVLGGQSVAAATFINDFSGGATVTAFTATFTAELGTVAGADGFSFNWATDLPGTAFGKEGAGTGLTVAFDTLYQGLSNPGAGSLTGTWAPDGRATSPFTVTGSKSRDTTLATFNGLASGGNWTLFVADLSAGGVGRLNGWALNVTGTPVPEPGAVAAVAGVCTLAFGLGRRFRR